MRQSRILSLACAMLASLVVTHTAAAQSHTARHHAAAASTETRPAARALADAEAQPKRLFHGISMTPQERAHVDSVEKEYGVRLAEIRRELEAKDHPAAASDTALARRIRILAIEERRSLRPLLTMAQQKAFDRNAAKSGN